MQRRDSRGRQPQQGRRTVRVRRRRRWPRSRSCALPDSISLMWCTWQKVPTCWMSESSSAPPPEPSPAPPPASSPSRSACACSGASGPGGATADLRRKAPTYACPLCASMHAHVRYRFVVNSGHGRPRQCKNAVGKHKEAPAALQLLQLLDQAGVLHRHGHDVAREQRPPRQRDGQHLCAHAQHSHALPRALSAARQHALRERLHHSGAATGTSRCRISGVEGTSTPAEPPSDAAAPPSPLPPPPPSSLESPAMLRTCRARCLRCGHGRIREPRPWFGTATMCTT